MHTESPTNHSERIRALEDAVVEHRVRLENGTKVFGDLRERVEKVEPKPVSPLKIVSLTLSVVGMGVATLLWLTDNFSERPTRAETVETIDKHERGGHEETKDDIRAIQQQQAEQRMLIRDVQEKQKTQSDKLDQLLERVPARRR